MTPGLNLEGYSKSKKWCVPSACALLTGLPLKDMTERLSFIRDEPYSDLSGCWMEEAVLLLRECGYQSRPVDLISRYPALAFGPTLRRYMLERPPLERVQPTLIEVDGHALASHFDMLFDNGTPKGDTIKRFPKMGRLVKAVWIVTPVGRS